MSEEYELYKKLKEAAEALETYEKANRSYSNSVWKSDIEREFKSITLSKALNAAGRDCRRCNGSGVEPGT